MKQIEWKYVMATLIALIIWFYVSPMLTTSTTTETTNGTNGSGNGNGNGASA